MPTAELDAPDQVDQDYPTPPKSSPTVRRAGPHDELYAVNAKQVFTHRLYQCLLCGTKSWRKLGNRRSNWQHLPFSLEDILPNLAYCNKCSHRADETNRALKEELANHARRIADRMSARP